VSLYWLVGGGICLGAMGISMMDVSVFEKTKRRIKK